MCITCILEDRNKQFELASLDDAFAKENSLLEIARQKLEDEQVTLEDIECQIRDHLDAIRDGLHEKQSSITTFFNDVRKMIDAREKDLLDDYEQMHDKEVQRTKSYASLVSQKRSTLSDSLNIIKEICNIKDKVIILGQLKEVNNLIEIGFKSVKAEKLQFAFKDFKPELEMRNILKVPAQVDVKHMSQTKSKTPRIQKDAVQVKEKDHYFEEIPKSVLRPSLDSPKATHTGTATHILETGAPITGHYKSKPVSSIVSSIGHTPMSRSLISRDKNKPHELSRDKSSRKDTKLMPAPAQAKDKKKENMPPKTASQSASQVLAAQANKSVAKNLKKYSSKYDETKQKTCSIGPTSKKDSTEDELGKISLTVSLTEDKPDFEPAIKSPQATETIFTKVATISESSQSQPLMIKKITDLDKARALKKAASKISTLMAPEKLSTPTKGDSIKDKMLHGSWSKSMNKKALVDRDQLNFSENQSMRLTDMKPTLLPETESPAFVILGKKIVNLRRLWL